MQKTGSQVLDSICISEAEKQAVLTLIREEVHSSITLILQCCMSSVYLFIYLYFFYFDKVSFMHTVHAHRKCLLSDHH